MNRIVPRRALQLPMEVLTRLGRILFCLALGWPLLAEDPPIRISGTGTGIGVLKILGQRFEKENPAFHVQVLPSIGSTGGIRAVADGKLQIACSSRPLRPEETALGVREQPFARTPLVFAVQTGNPIEAMELHEIIGMYEGRVTHWPTGAPVRVVLRPRSDTAHALICGISKEMAVAVEKGLARPGAILAMTDQDGADQLEKSSGSLGTTALGLMKSESRKLKALAFNGIRPDLDAFARGTYPFSIPLSLVLPREGVSPGVERFLRFLRSRTALEILRNNGFLPPPPPPADRR